MTNVNYNEDIMGYEEIIKEENIEKLDLTEKIKNIQGLKCLFLDKFKNIKELNLSFNNLSDLNIFEGADLAKLNLVNLELLYFFGLFTHLRFKIFQNLFILWYSFLFFWNISKNYF